MDRRIKPWVNKKIVEYIGEEEPTLTDFICQKVMANSEPQSILNDVAMVRHNLLHILVQVYLVVNMIASCVNISKS